MSNTFNDSNIIDFFSKGEAIKESQKKIIRLALEFDGFEILYSNDLNPSRYFGIKILGWAMMQDGSVDAVVPWLNQLVVAKQITDGLNGQYHGYYDRHHHIINDKPPKHKVQELENNYTFFKNDSSDPDLIIQELNDHIGTHAMISDGDFKKISLFSVSSWRLLNDGRILAMVANEKTIKHTPILVGDDSLYPVQEHSDFKYFFHYKIANKLKSGDPEAIRAFQEIIDSE